MAQGLRFSDNRLFAGPGACNRGGAHRPVYRGPLHQAALQLPREEAGERALIMHCRLPPHQLYRLQQVQRCTLQAGQRFPEMLPGGRGAAGPACA